MRRCKRKKIEPFIDMFKPLKCKQVFGAPIGGIGSGSIGRTFSGDFCRFQLIPGKYQHTVAEANMFSVCIRKNNSTVYQQALTTRESRLKGLKTWNMSFPATNGSYYALYPEAWTIYNIPSENVTLTSHQVSPIIPHNYKDSSLPVALFNLTAENTGNEEIELSLMFTWQSGPAGNEIQITNVKSKSFKHENYGAGVSGVILSQEINRMPLEYCISSQNSVSNIQNFTPQCFN